ncbi:MAG: choice-of-anchor D domain-containing protein [Burkholderiaceae bacterium]
MNATRRIAAVFAGVIGLCMLSAAHGADAVRGKALFANTNGAPESCGSASCHSGFPTVQRNGITKGSNPSAILNAIAGNKGGMRTLTPYVNTTDANDIAAYIANPAAGNGAAAILVSAASLTFAAQTLGTTSAAQIVTVTNTGTAVLTLSGLTLAGAAGSEYARGGTCQIGTSVAAGGNCSIQVTFTPTVAGTRSATLTISHNASGGTSSVSLVGTGAPPAAAASVTPTLLSFTQTINTSSIAQAVTVRNSGGQPLTLSSIGISGANASEFLTGAASTCVAGTVLNANASCNLQLAFRPTAAGARTATLSVAHNAAASPATVALSGTGTATPQPGVSLSAPSLSFGTLSVGEQSTVQTVTLTNTGQAPLTLASLTLAGSAAGDFALSGGCMSGATLAPGSSCGMQLAFTPTGVGTRSGSLTVASNASNGSQIVSLSGSGVQYAIAVNPIAATLQSIVGSMSEPMQAVVSNTGASPLMLTSIVTAGPFVMQQGVNACGAGPMALTPAQSCNVYVAFQPAAAGPASGEVIITSAAIPSGSMRIALNAQASVAQADIPGASSAAVAPSNAGAGCSVGPTDQLVDPLLAVLLAAALFELFRRRRARPGGRD